MLLEYLPFASACPTLILTLKIENILPGKKIGVEKL